MQNDPSASWCAWVTRSASRRRRRQASPACGRQLGSTRPACDRREPVESDTDLRGFGWRRDPHGRHVWRPVFTVQLRTSARLLGSASLANCGRMLSRVPTTITHIDRNYDTLQFINVAINPGEPELRSKAGRRTTARGRTTIPRTAGTTGRRTSTETAATPATTARIPHGGSTSSRARSRDANFENGDPTKWVIISAPLVNSGEAVGFYWPQIADPNPPTGAHPIFSGSSTSGARGRSARVRIPRAVPQDTNAEHRHSTRRTVLSSPSFGGQPGCGDFQPLGGSAGLETMPAT